MVDAVIFLIYGLTWCIGVTTIMKTIKKSNNNSSEVKVQTQIIPDKSFMLFSS